MSDTPGTGPRRRRRPLLLVFITLLTPAFVIVVAAVAASTTGPSDPSVPVALTPGYQAVSDPYFGYAIPVGWNKISGQSDSTGDLYYEGTSGWSGENERVRAISPVPGGPAPASLASFGASVPTPFRLLGGHPVRVPGASFSYEYRLARGGRIYATAIDAWDRHTQTELWLVVQADAAITRKVLDSLTT
ncbi:MAG: hypothetical protein ACYC1D_01185 [Acidimicrobiales bacterium]